MHSTGSTELRLVSRIIRSALKEDMGAGDITTRATVPPRQKARAVITAKSGGVLSGSRFCARTFSLLNPRMDFTFHTEDGSSLKKGQTVLEIRGSARAILTAERTALNLLCRMSGIATATARLVALAAGTNATILDTRKTAPGLRFFDKYAVRDGGGDNHRRGLDDMFLIKENHIAAAGDITEAVRKCAAARDRKSTLIVAEATSLTLAEKAAEAGADRVLLDNMTPSQVREVVRTLKGRVDIEVSGGITPKNVRVYAETGADYISVGMLTHSVTPVDFSLLIV